MNYYTAIILLFFSITILKAQDSQRPELQFSGFIDVYYGFDFNRPFDNQRPDFLFNHTRHNEVSLNLGLLQMDVIGNSYRASLGLMTGTYAQYNLADEPDILRNIFEAYVGVALDPSKKLWFDAGVFSSHIGFESAISSENFTLTRSLVAENSPYFLTGAKLTYTQSDQWEFEVGIFNGWQLIQRPVGNSTPAFGSRVTYTPNENVTFNWSTLVSNDFPDDDVRMRYYNNVYALLGLSENLSFILGFDYGLQQEAVDNTSLARRKFEHWFTPTAILKIKMNESWAMALRGEYFQDINGVVIDHDSPSGFKTSGISCNLDKKINSNLLLRVEARHLQNDTPFYTRNTALVKGNTLLITSLALTFP